MEIKHSKLNKIYTVLKWVTLIFVPQLLFYVSLEKISKIDTETLFIFRELMQTESGNDFYKYFAMAIMSIVLIGLVIGYAIYKAMWFAIDFDDKRRNIKKETIA